MKKIICLVLPLIMIFGICACSDYRVNDNFMDNQPLAEAYNKILLIDSDLNVIEDSYDIAAKDLKDNIGDLLDMRAYTDKSCTQDEFTVIIGVFDKLCENAEELKANLDQVDKGTAKLDGELVKALQKNCKDYENLFKGKTE